MLDNNELPIQKLLNNPLPGESVWDGWFGISTKYWMYSILDDVQSIRITLSLNIFFDVNNTQVLNYCDLRRI